MADTVRDANTEERVYQTLERTQEKTWNVATLSKELGVSRAKIERAFVALEVEERITVEHAIGNSWIPHIRRPEALPNGKKGKGT